MAFFKGFTETYRPGIGVALWGYFIVCVLTLSSFGLNWDTMLNEALLGECYYAYFATGDSRYLDLQNPPMDFSRISEHPDLLQSPLRHVTWHTLPVPWMLSALSCDLFAYRLGWMHPIDAHHLPSILATMILMAALFYVSRSAFGSLAAFGGVLFLAGFPRYFGHVHNNPKDIVTSAFVGCALLAFYQAFQQKSALKTFLAAILFGVALGSKANALFIPAILATWFILTEYRSLIKNHVVPLRFAVTLVLYLPVGFLTVYLLWPYLWTDTSEHLHLFFATLFNRYQEAKSWNTILLVEIFAATPPPMLLGLIAVPCLLKRFYRHLDLHFLIFMYIWVSIPILRHLLPGTPHFNGIRHLIEFVPPFCFLAGLGFSMIHQRLERYKTHRRLRYLRPALWGLTCLWLLWVNISIYPFNTVYFNSLIGGLPGARKIQVPDATDYWASSYRLGIKWLNEHAEPHSGLAVPIAEHIVRVGYLKMLRDDIRLLPLTDATSPQMTIQAYSSFLQYGKSHPLYILTILLPSWENEINAYAEKHCKIVQEWRVDGTAIARIYRF